MARSDRGREPRDPGARTPGGTPPAECWVLDVDGCIVDSLSGTSLRPGAAALLAHLARHGRVVVWSAGGADYARARAEQLGVAQHVDAYASKEGRDDEGFYRTDHLPVTGARVVFVDDRPEDLARGLDVMTVFPYISRNRYDRGLEEVARRAGMTWPDPTA